MKDLFEKFKEFAKKTYGYDVVRSDEGVALADIFDAMEVCELMEYSVDYSTNTKEYPYMAKSTVLQMEAFPLSDEYIEAA